jgi:hypothetical protein
MTNQLSQAPPVEVRIPPFSPVNHRQIARQRLRSPPIQILQRPVLRQPFQISVIAGALFPLGQHEQLLGLGDGEERPPRRKRADIESFDVSREPSIRVIVPQDRLRPVGHVFVAKRTGTHRFKHGRLEGAAHAKGDLDRCPVTVLFIQSLRTFFADRTERHHPGAGTKPAAQVMLQGQFLQRRHRY